MNDVTGGEDVFVYSQSFVCRFECMLEKLTIHNYLQRQTDEEMMLSMLVIRMSRKLVSICWNSLMF